MLSDLSVCGLCNFVSFFLGLLPEWGILFEHISSNRIESNRVVGILRVVGNSDLGMVKLIMARVSGG